VHAAPHCPALPTTGQINGCASKTESSPTYAPALVSFPSSTQHYITTQHGTCQPTNQPATARHVKIKSRSAISSVAVVNLASIYD
jgi:hypothetical protein